MRLGEKNTKTIYRSKQLKSFTPFLVWIRVWIQEEIMENKRFVLLYVDDLLDS
jgi:hypothetical protein